LPRWPGLDSEKGFDPEKRLIPALI